jgi:hypothetical protein
MHILHLTDLHYQTNNPFQKNLIAALLADLKSNGSSPDFVVFSGDLVKNPDDPEIYSHFRKEFLTPVQDIDLLDFLSEQFSDFSSTLEGYVRPLAWADRLEKLNLLPAKKEDSVAFTDSINKQLTGDMKAETRDEAVDQKEPTNDVRPLIKRPDTEHILLLWIQTLRAYTVSLKNLENIPKAQKEHHLQKILEGWSTVMLYSCILFKEIVEKRTLQIGPVTFKINLPDTLDARILRLIFLHIPVYITDVVRRDLGSQKLALQLRNNGIAKTLSESFLQTSLYADLKLDEYLGQLAKFRDRASENNSHIFLEFMLIKLRDIFLRLGLAFHEQEAFLRMAGQLSADIKGLTGDDHQREVDRYVVDLRKRDQVQRLKDNIR